MNEINNFNNTVSIDPTLLEEYPYLLNFVDYSTNSSNQNVKYFSNRYIKDIY